MLLNGYLIDYIEKWDKKPKGEVKRNDVGNYIEPKENKVRDIEHKIKGIVKHQGTAEALKEMFSNPTFNIVTIEDFYIEQYNGIYQLVKGNIDLDGGTEHWVVSLWLENSSEWLKQSVLQDVFDNDYLQTKTSTYTDIINYNAKSGTWGVYNDGIGATSGSENLLSFGYDWWNSIIYSADLVFDSISTTTKIGLLFNYGIYDGNYYKVELRYDGTYNWADLKKVELGDELTISSYKLTDDDLVTGLVVGTPYNIKIIYSARRIDVYFDYKHIISAYDDSFVSGRLGMYISDTNGFFKNIVVEKYIPTATTIPAGYNFNKFPDDNRYIRTSDGLLQNIVNYEEEIVNKTYLSRALVGEVKVWDTMDNDFSNTYIPQMPLRWRRVYNINHKFTGNMYIENGIFGILFSSSGIDHYVYVNGHEKGDKINIDFEQNPNYDIWNESYTNRRFYSENQGIPNWNEYGLNFKRVHATNGKDRIYNNIDIPEYRDSMMGRVFDSEIDIEFKKSTETKSYEVSQVLLAGIANGSGNTFHTLKYNEPVDEVIAVSYDGTTSTQHGVPSQEGISQKITSKLFRNRVDGSLIYKDGMLSDENPYATNKIYVDYLFSIGETLSGTWNDPYNGDIKNVSHNIMNSGKEIPRTLRQPIMWHTLDNNSYDHGNRKYVDKGSKGIDLFINGTSTYYKINHRGRYNQSFTTQDLSGGYAALFNNSLTTEFDNLEDTGLTVEMWLQYADTPANYQTLFKIGGSTLSERSFMVYLSSTDLVVDFWDTTSASQKGYSIPISSLTIDFTTDTLWHHLAVTYDGTYFKIYIDGVLQGTSGDLSGYELYRTPYFVQLGECEFVCTYDSLMVYDYPKEPEEFGVIIKDNYHTGQWYSKAEVEQLPNGDYRRKDNPHVAQYEMDIVGDLYGKIANRNTGETYNNSNKYCTYVPGIVGLGLRSLDGTSDGQITLQTTNDAKVSWWDDHTVQFYMKLNTVVSDRLIIMFTRAYGDSGDIVPYIRTLSNDIDLYMTGSGITATTVTKDNSFTLSTGKWYNVAVVFEPTSKSGGNANLYVDGSLYKSYSYTGKLNEYHRAEFSPSWSHNDVSISNLIHHSRKLHPSELGIVCDTKNEIAKKAYSLKRINQAGSALSLTDFKLKSITPENVIVSVVDTADGDNSTFNCHIESGSYHAKIESAKHKMKARSSNGDVFRLDLEEDFIYRFVLGIPEDANPIILDSELYQTSFNFALSTSNSVKNFLLFNNNRNNMMLSIGLTNEPTYSNRLQLDYSNGISKCYIRASDGSNFSIGFSPNRSVNETFWESTYEEPATTILYDAGSWFMSKVRAGSASWTVIEPTESLNGEKYEKGLYFVIGRGRGINTSTPWDASVYNTVKLRYITSEQVTGSSYQYSYAMSNVIKAYENDKMRTFIRTMSADSTYGDYMVIIPITNGIDMPLDILRLSMQKLTKLKILH